MTYQQYGLVQATDFNALVGDPVTSAADVLNSVLGVGYGKFGYGQTIVSKINVGETVSTEAWEDLISNTILCAMHQGSAQQTLSAPAKGSTITYLSATVQNVKNIYAAKNNAMAQGTTVAHTISNGATWGNNLVFTFTVTFDTSDKARYFFNAGGQLKITVGHPAGDRLNQQLNGLCLGVGTLVFSGMGGSDTAVISGGSFRGFTQVGGIGSPVIYSQQYGYYGLTTTETTVFRQTISGLNAAYNKYADRYQGTYVQVSASTNGANGANGDNGNVLTFVVTFVQIPTHGVPLSSGTSATLTVVPPATSGQTVNRVAPRSPISFTNTWGTVLVDKTVTGSVF